MKLISWNVNGLRACLKKGFMASFTALDADIFCLQETKLQHRAGQVELELPGYHQFWNSAEKKGYSGVAVFTRAEPLSRDLRPGTWTEHDHEGRVITAGISRVLPGLLLHPQCPERAQAPGLPDDLGGRLPGLSPGPGREKAGDPLWRPERGPPGDRPEKPQDQPAQRRFHRRGAGEDDPAALRRFYRHLPRPCIPTQRGPTPGGATASTPGRRTPGGASTTSSSQTA